MDEEIVIEDDVIDVEVEDDMINMDDGAERERFLLHSSSLKNNLNPELHAD